MPFIYLAVYADGTAYVGQTIGSLKQLEQRYASYTKKAKAQRPSEKAAFALGMPALGVIEYCPPEKLNERETYWIAAHRNEGRTLNQDFGGACGSGKRYLDKLRRMESKLAKAARRALK